MHNFTAQHVMNCFKLKGSYRKAANFLKISSTYVYNKLHEKNPNPNNQKRRPKNKISPRTSRQIRKYIMKNPIFTVSKIKKELNNGCSYSTMRRFIINLGCYQKNVVNKPHRTGSFEFCHKN